MASSRIFVRSLPPTYTQDEFKQHFSQNGKREVTDVKLFPQRRIGYIGFRTHEDAQRAVKYFNKSFIRMSRIGVEIATPVEETSITKGRSRALSTRPQKSDGLQSAPAAEANKKRKRDDEKQEEQDPKLKEFLNAMRPKSKKKEWESAADEIEAELRSAHVQKQVAADAASDDEYEQDISMPSHVPDLKERSDGDQIETVKATASHSDELDEQEVDEQFSQQPVSDADWARSRTSRLLGLLDDDEEESAAATIAQNRFSGDYAREPEDEHTIEVKQASRVANSMRTNSSDDQDESAQADVNDQESTPPTMRLFVRNLPYAFKTEDLESEFASYGNLEDIHVPLDSKTGLTKGFAFIQYSDPESAERALAEQDGKVFQGRLIHVLPSAPSRSAKLNDFELSKLPLKKQQEIKRKRESESKSFNWNSLYMNADAVVSSVADRLGLSKSEVLDPTSSDAAVRQAHAETHVIQETKSYFKQEGVDLDSFKKRLRGDRAILIKNIPYDFTRTELRHLLDEQGDVKRFAMPPSGGIAIVEYSNVAQCKIAWQSLSYRRVRNSVLLLEKAPADVFVGKASDGPVLEPARTGVNKVSTADLVDVQNSVPDTPGTATLFVRNLNFSTSSPMLADTFKPFDGFLSARVKTKSDPRKPGQVLSMGFGFLEFSTAAQAQTALQIMDGHVLEGHSLQIRASHKGNDVAEERKQLDAQKRAAKQGTKVLIKNLPFEATRKDVQTLFGAYGQLRSVRVPKKMDRSTRGFAFADFMTAKEAQNAIETLRDTHLLGRRLVLDFAAEDATDAEAEIERMQRKVGAQINKVALRKLTGSGRKKFTTQTAEDDAT